MPNTVSIFNVFKQAFYLQFQWFLAFSLHEDSKLIYCLKS